MRDLDLDELGAFGIRPADEGVHPVDPDDPSWNESIFYDWVDATGAVAGHCRIGRMPNQGRCWFWLFLHQDGECLAVEEPRLPIAAMHGDGYAYDGFGLAFEREVVDPLRTSRLRARGIGRVVKGPRAGVLLPFDVALEARAAGPAHSIGDRDVDGHTSDRYESNRFEQPIHVRCTQRVGERTHAFDGHGERDHSWGPRYWNMEWWFLAVANAGRAIQCARVVFDEESFLSLGYHRAAPDGAMRHVEEARFDLAYSDELDRAFAGRVALHVEGGATLDGRIETITAAEIDASHAFVPPQPSIYRRAVVRFVPGDGGETMLGYLEVNRFPGGLRHEDA